MAETVNTVILLQLMDRIRDGDLAARDELIRGVGNRLETMARQMLRGFPTVRRWADTDDVLQNSLMRLLRSLQDIQCTSKRDFLGLAATQIRRELLDLARHFSASRFLASVGEIPAHALDRLDVSSASNGLDIDAWSRFHEAVETLPAQEREVVELVFYHQLTQAQVADFLQVHVRTVRRWWQSALATLRLAVRESPAEISAP